MSNNLKKKSNEQSQNLKEQGNKHFMGRRFEDALFFFNKALCYAESKEHLAFAYGNRSAVYCELKLYDECLQNIKWAKENGYPLDKMAKLDEREAKCIKKKEAITYDPSEDPVEFFKLSYPPNPKIPFIVDCIEMKKNSKFGRGIYATRDLKPGDFIAIEESQIRLLYELPRVSYLFCANCLKSCMHNLIPCTKSPSYMFCSEECREKVYRLLPDLNRLILPSDNGHFCHDKIFADMLDKFGSRENLLKFIKETNFEKFDLSIFDLDLSDPSHPDYGQNLIKCFLTFTSAFKRVAPNFVGYKEPSTQITQGNKDLTNFLKHAMGVFQLDAKTLLYGALTTSFGGLFNHSCIPNVERVQLQNKIAYYIVRPVKAGQQLFESYFMGEDIGNYYYCDFMERNLITKVWHGFACDCKACKLNLPSSQYRMDIITGNAQLRSFQPADTLKGMRDQLNEHWTIVDEKFKDLRDMEVPRVIHINKKVIEYIAMKATSPFGMKIKLS